jgi:hypothetical protein
MRSILSVNLHFEACSSVEQVIDALAALTNRALIYSTAYLIDIQMAMNIYGEHTIQMIHSMFSTANINIHMLHSIENIKCRLWMCTFAVEIDGH